MISFNLVRFRSNIDFGPDLFWCLTSQSYNLKDAKPIPCERESIPLKIRNWQLFCRQRIDTEVQIDPNRPWKVYIYPYQLEHRITRVRLETILPNGPDLRLRPNTNGELGADNKQGPESNKDLGDRHPSINSTLFFPRGREDFQECDHSLHKLTALKRSIFMSKLKIITSRCLAFPRFRRLHECNQAMG